MFWRMISFQFLKTYSFFMSLKSYLVLDPNPWAITDYRDE